jgi:pterin-4a-carbinolamine dehydratase
VVIHEGWKVSGDRLVRELSMRDFDEAMRMAERIAEAAEDHFRRPDMCITDFNRLRIIVANPHHAGITEAERRLAAKVDAVLG